MIVTIAASRSVFGLVLTAGFVVLSLGVGVWVYVDARTRFGADVAPLAAIAVAGLLLAGTLPGLIALVVAEDPVVQGFPTALRIVPGIVALGVYLYARRMQPTVGGPPER